MEIDKATRHTERHTSSRRGKTRANFSWHRGWLRPVSQKSVGLYRYRGREGRGGKRISRLWSEHTPFLHTRGYPTPLNPLPSGSSLAETTSTTSFIGQRPDRARNIESTPPSPPPARPRVIFRFPYFYIHPIRTGVESSFFCSQLIYLIRCDGEKNAVSLLEYIVVYDI